MKYKDWFAEQDMARSSKSFLYPRQRPSWECAPNR
jgi:hypothetical protein